MRKITRLMVVLLMAVILSSVAFAAAPGLNLLTGTTEAQTFDDMTTLPSTVNNAVLDDSPIAGENGKVLRNQYSYTSTSSYATVGFSFNPALDRNRPYQISFKAYKWAEEGYGVTNTQLWIMKNGTAGWQIAKDIGSFAAGKTNWYEHNYTVTTFGSLTNTSTGLLDETDIDTIYFEWQYDSAQSMNTTEKVYFDDVSIIPAYKITYLDEDGGVIKSEYKVITEKTFTPDVLPSDKAMGIIGWSANKDGTADETINLHNEDFSLHAVYDNSLRINLSADKTLLVESGDDANLLADLWRRNGTDGVTVSYSVAEGSSYVTLSDNGGGTATVTAKGEGLAKIVCTASTGESEYIYILCDYQSVERPEVIQTVPSISASNWLYDHQGATFNETEGAWEVTKRTDVLKPDGTTYYNNGFLSISASVDTSTYKYLLFRLKADRSTSFQVRMNMSGTYFSATYPTIAATGSEYVDVAVDIATPVSFGTISQYVLGVTNHNDTVYIKDITLSNIPTYEPEIPEVKSIKVVKKISEISDDAGIASVEAAIFTNKGSDSAVAWKSSSDCIAVKNLGNGKAQLMAMSDGTATITAYAEGDETVSESFTVTVSGQREKQAVYDIRILFWGASTTKHPPSASLGWYGDWGMAASAEENDYVHKLVSYLEEEYYPSKVTFEIIANSEWDAAITPETDKNKDWSTHAKYLEMEEAMKSFRPNIIMTAQTGNMQATADGDVAYNAYKQMYDMMFSYCPDAIIVAQYCGTWHSAMKEEFMARLGENYSDKYFYLLHNDVAGVIEYLAPEFENSGVANHWGDKGHERVAQQCFALANPIIPSAIEPTYIYIPKEIEITGDTKVDEKGESLQLAVEVTPNDASADVSWSVDNSNIALISKNGLLSPLSNGTVVVTAKSAYNDKIFDTHTVVITNQLDNFTLTYAPGTTDEVTGLPEADEYAAGKYVLSTAIPLRDAYTFVGWGLEEGAEETVTSVNMTKPITVYAIWKKTDGFEFDGTYDENNGFIYGFSIESGFHNNVADGSLRTTCTAGAKVTFNTPVLDIENKGFVSFGLKSAYTDEDGKIELTVKTADSEKTFIYPLTSKNYTTYVADISSLSGNITGVKIYVNTVPADSSMFDIGLDYIRFVPARSVTTGEFAVSSGNVTISSLEYNGYTAIRADKESTFVVTLDGGYSYEFKNTSAIYATATEGEMFTVNVLTFNAVGSYTESTMKVYNAAAAGVEEMTEMSTLTTYDTSSLRFIAPTGLRVKASVSTDFYTFENVDEYGYVVAREDSITSGKIYDVILNDEYLDAKTVVYGAAYSKSEGIHKVFESDDDTEFFTAVLTNIPMREDALKASLVFRPYVKLSDGSILYGAKVNKTVYDVAVSIYYHSDDEAAKTMAKEIIDICGDPFDNDIGIELDDLFKD